MLNLKRIKTGNSVLVAVILMILAGSSSLQAFETSNESAIVERLVQSASFQTETAKDPFRQLIQKPVFVPPQRDVRVKEPITQTTEQAPVIKPLELMVTGIVGNDNHRLAIVISKNQELVLHQDQQVDQEFKVIDIQPDRLVVYSNREKARRTFRLAGN